MKKDFSVFSLSGGIILLVIQLLTSSFDFLDGSYYMTEQFAVVEKVTFESFLSFVWAALIGTILLIVSFLFRFTSRSALLLELAGLALWLFQMYRMFDIVKDFGVFVSKSFLSVVGAVLVSITVIYDICMLIRAREK